MRSHALLHVHKLDEFCDLMLKLNRQQILLRHRVNRLELELQPNQVFLQLQYRHD